MSDWAGIAWLVVLLAFNAFFVGAEFAVISARRSQIEPRAEKGSRSAKTALYAMEHATLMLATSQLGITICSLLILNVSEPAIHHLLAGPLGLTGLSEARGRHDRLHHRADRRVVPPRRLRRDGAEEPGVLGARPRGAHARDPAGVGLEALPPGDRRAQLDLEPRRPAVPRRAEGRGRIDLHARRGRDDREPVAHRGRARTMRPARSPPRSSSPTRRRWMSRCRSPTSSRFARSATPDKIERAVAKHGFSRYVIVDARGRAARLRAPQGRPAGR